MDLLATVRKEGSRGGQGDFKWSDVQNSARREHYLGHSLMAPVGRWAKGRDPNWYTRNDETNNEGEDPADKAARERREEIQRVKEAEEDAIARALGLPVPPRNNANMEPVSDKRQSDGISRHPPAADKDISPGLGHRKHAGDTDRDDNEAQEKELQSALKEYRRRHRDDERKHSSHGHDRHRHHRRPDRDRDTRESRPRDGSRDRHRSRRSRSRSPSHRQRRYRDRSRSKSRSRSRSRSPYQSQRRERKRH